MSAIPCEDGCDCHGGTTSDGRRVVFVEHLSCPSCGNQLKLADVHGRGGDVRRSVLHIDPMCPWFSGEMDKIDRHPVGSAERRAALAAIESSVTSRRPS